MSKKPRKTGRKERPCNEFTLFFEHIEDSRGEPWARPRILIDGVLMEEKLSVSILHLVASLQNSGKYFVFTCGCGHPGCVGVEEGIRVKHKNGFVNWEYRLPQSSDGFGSEGENAFEAWLDQAVPKWSVFRREQIIGQVYQALSEACHLYPDKEDPNGGLVRADIEVLLSGLEDMRQPSGVALP